MTAAASPKATVSTSIPVLSLGTNDFFVARLYREVRKICPKFSFVVSDYIRYGDAVNFNEEQAFAGHIKTHTCAFDFRTATGLIRACFQRQLYRRILAAAFFRGRPLAPDTISYAIRSARLHAELRSHKRYAIWHVHFCSAKSLALADARPAGTHLVCSFWGSDLLRAPDGETQWHVRRTVRQAAAITVQSVELREFVLSLYGRDLIGRVHICRFPTQNELLDSLERLPAGIAGRQQARASIGIPDGAYVIVIGNNGNPSNQQAPVIAQLATLPARIRETLFLVLPSGYGISAIEAVAKQARELGMRCRVIEEFLDWPQLACVRAAADVTIHVPISDALSHLIIEALYAGSRVISGAWLPYGPYRRAGLQFSEVETLAQLPTAIRQAIAAGTPNETGVNETRRRIRETASPEALVPAWVHLYRTVLGESENG